MSFNQLNFSPVGGHHGQSQDNSNTGIAIYSYITADALSAVVAAGYFNELRDNMFNGDVVYIGASQLDDDSSDNEYSIRYFNSVPRSPSISNVTLSNKKIDAS